MAKETLKSLLYQFAKEKHPRIYKRWIKDLIDEKNGIVKTCEGFTKEKQEILNDYYKNN